MAKDGWVELKSELRDRPAIKRRGGRYDPQGTGSYAWHAPHYLDHQANFGPWLNGGDWGARLALFTHDPFDKKVYVNMPHATPEQMKEIDAEKDGANGKWFIISEGEAPPWGKLQNFYDKTAREAKARAEGNVKETTPPQPQLAKEATPPRRGERAVSPAMAPSEDDGWVKLDSEYVDRNRIKNRGGKFRAQSGKKNWYHPPYLDKENLAPWMPGADPKLREALRSSDPFDGKIYLNMPNARADQLELFGAEKDPEKGKWYIMANSRLFNHTLLEGFYKMTNQQAKERDPALTQEAPPLQTPKESVEPDRIYLTLKDKKDQAAVALLNAMKEPEGDRRYITEEQKRSGDFAEWLPDSTGKVPGRTWLVARNDEDHARFQAEGAIKAFPALPSQGKYYYKPLARDDISSELSKTAGNVVQMTPRTSASVGKGDKIYLTTKDSRDKAAVSQLKARMDPANKQFCITQEQKESGAFKEWLPDPDTGKVPGRTWLKANGEKDFAELTALGAKQLFSGRTDLLYFPPETAPEIVEKWRARESATAKDVAPHRELDLRNDHVHSA